MAKLYYCGMADQNDKPKIGRNARLLGVRPNIDIDIEQMPSGCVDDRGYLKPKAERKHNGEYEAALAKTQDDWKRVK